jgi:hypothetical protein
MEDDLHAAKKFAFICSASISYNIRCQIDCLPLTGHPKVQLVYQDGDKDSESCQMSPGLRVATLSGLKGTNVSKRRKFQPLHIIRATRGMSYDHGDNAEMTAR